MNLQENIHRIKQVMGINESALTHFKRTLYNLPKYVVSTYKWLNPPAFISFSEFIERVAFSTTRDFVADNYKFNNPAEYEQIREELADYIREYIFQNHLEEIKEYYLKNR